MDLGDRLVAEAALGGVDDPLEGEVVRGLGDDAQVSERVAELGPLVESEAADDPVGQADGDEAVLELTGLELGPEEDRGLGDPAAAALNAFDLLADPPRVLGPGPDADDPDLVAAVVVGPQGLAEAAAIMGDEAGGGGEDVRRGAVILLEADDLGAREILLEPEDVGDLRAAPGIAALVLVADAADALALVV